MINFYYNTDFTLKNEDQLSEWIKSTITLNDFELGEISYIFCDDAYLLDLNVQFLQHDTLTDIISFDNTIGKEINGEIYISVERVKENAKDFKCSFDDELHRVMIHGVLHYLGFKDKTEDEKQMMRNKENEYLYILNN